MEDKGGGQRPNLPAVALLVLTNTVMVLNQVNPSTIYLLIGSEFHETVTGLGLLTASYFLAYGVFIVPGGIIAAKFGPRKTILSGALLSSAVLLASAFSPSFGSLMVLRFFAGLGYALVFPSSLILTVRYFRGRDVGLSMGLSAVAYSIGGTVAFFGWPVLGALVGWRLSILAGGVLASIPSFTMLVLLPGEEPLPSFDMTLRRLGSVVFSRPIIILATMLLGVGATIALSSSFMVYYLENQFSASPGFAGLVAGLNTVVQMFMGVAVGRLYDRTSRVRVMLLAMAALLSFGVSLASLGSIPAAVASSVLSAAGAAGGYVVAYSATRDSIHSLPGYHTLALVWVNSFGFIGQVISPIYFSFIVVGYGYSTAWLVGGVVAVLLALPVIGLRHVKKVDTDPRSRPHGG